MSPDRMTQLSDQEIIDGARRYVDLSNDHDIDAISAILDTEATYASNRVGSYAGQVAILEMMTVFFADFPDVRWRTSEIPVDEDGAAAFGFVMTATNAATGEQIELRGQERIRFTVRSLIAHVEVEA